MIYLNFIKDEKNILDLYIIYLLSSSYRISNIIIILISYFINKGKLLFYIL